MDLESLKAKGIEPYIMIDTCDFMDYCINKHGYTNGSFHDKIWRPHMCDCISNGEAYASFSRNANPENVFDELLNSFLDDFPEFGNDVSMIFTN